ncbi:hypothetical protein F4820DRAFT_440969 [Hypoxylon rubiginosum]|uniref:Uncharacterized protein n=1 Tax=Hypoxylon rubiginosum TaxID=110542 RepID=A0ACB9YIP7_9PEZI|nr:hypothetical protein F4820DRAFT_440969 [Hypoxylon rubiginosum]
MSADALREVPRLTAGEEEGSEQAQSIFSIDSPEELVQFRRSEIERLRQDANAPVAQLITALLQLGVALADHPDLGDVEPPFREAKELMDSDAASPYSLERLVYVQTWARVLQGTKEFDAADALYSAAVDETRHSRGREHPWTLELQNNLGCLRTAAGTWYATQGFAEKAKDCFDGADMLFKKSYKAKLRVFDPLHRATLKTKCNISVVSFLRGDASELESDLVGALQGLSQSYGTEDSSVKEVANHLVSIYRRIGNYDRVVEISEQFGVDTPEDYKIRPFEDNFIPGLLPRPELTDAVSDYVDGRQQPAEILRNVLDIVGPSRGRLSVQVLSWIRDKVKKWTGMNVFTFFEAMGLPDLAYWSVITRREVLLEQAAAAAHFEAVEVLLQKMPKDSNTADGALIKAFHRAVESGNSDIIRLFLDHGVKPSVTDDEGQSALHKAAELGLEDAFVELISCVENVDLKNSSGDTALDLALRRNNEQIIRAVMIEKCALISSSKSTTATGTKKKLDKSRVEVWDEMLYTGLDATIVDFYVDHMVEEHRVQTKPVEAVVSDPDLLRSIINDEESDEKADFTWIHVPANNMFWIETLMKNLAEVSEDKVRYSDFMKKEVWQNQLHESLHGAFHLGSHVVLYMPYIHWESNSMKNEMDEYIKKIETTYRNRWRNVVKSFVKDIFSKKRDEYKEYTWHLDEFMNTEETKLGPDFRLLATYLYLPDAPPLHVRRTFDQFQYYMNDDTAARDADQVVSRYFERRHPNATVPIMMVDQLWMWIIDNRILVTCFPQRWGGGGIARERGAIIHMRNVLHSILDRLKIKFREPIRTVYDLADLIMTRCLGLHSDSTQWQNERHRYLEIFEHSINYVTDEEIRRFNYFADGGRVGEKAKKRKPKETEYEERWLRRKREAEKFLAALESDSETGDIVDLAANAKRRWGIEKKDIEEIFDISDEIELLKEIKDIRDELNILRTLYDQQSHVLNSYSHASGRRPQPSDMEDAVKRLTNIVEKMDVDAQRPYKALEDLLDLKQKQANVSEARIARVSGNTITVFTIVTIVFLPASFMAAFFALPIAEYPFVDEQFHLNYAIKWTMSVTAAIAVPLIILAVYVNPIMRLIHLTSQIIRAVVRTATRVAKAAATLIGPVTMLLGMLLALLHLCGLLFCMSMFIYPFNTIKRIIRWGRGYRAAKKEARDKGEVWSGRRYILGGILQRNLDRGAARDEEEQRESSSRERSGSPRSTFSETSPGSEADRTRLSRR